MSVKIANISNEKWYIGGAPRSKYFGQVLMFRQVVAPYLRVERQHILTGGQFGEGFGYDIAVADFNADEWVYLLSCSMNTLSIVYHQSISDIIIIVIICISYENSHYRAGV